MSPAARGGHDAGKRLQRLPHRLQLGPRQSGFEPTSLRLADSDDRRTGSSPESEGSYKVDDLRLEIGEGRGRTGDSPSINAKNACIVTCRSGEQADHLAIRREEAHSDAADAARHLKIQYSNTDIWDELGRSAEHPTVIDQEILDVTLVILLGGRVRLGTIFHGLSRQARRCEKRCGSGKEETPPAPSNVARWPR
jgi:hypothetical protein